MQVVAGTITGWPKRTEPAILIQVPFTTRVPITLRINRDTLQFEYLSSAVLVHKPSRSESKQNMLWQDCFTIGGKDII